MNPVNARLGRNNYTARAHRKRVREVTNKLARETDWRGDLARSVQDVIDIDDCEEVYR
jgi:hypothetical protein